jgi:hypothetical protein
MKPGSTPLNISMTSPKPPAATKLPSGTELEETLDDAAEDELDQRRGIRHKETQLKNREGNLLVDVIAFENSSWL